jgi:putative spermidine/putrescine transport system ATP-binding protein
MAEISLQAITKSYGSHVVVDNFCLDIKDGEFVTLLGASGSGKTTCLRIVAGFVQPDTGRILFNGIDSTKLAASRRNTGMVFQQYALFPHLTVAQNVAYGLAVRRMSKKEIAEKVNEMLRLVHLTDLAERYPAQLSGGQKQRVALARAVVIRPAVLLLDEPLSALDLKLRGELQTEIRRIQQALRITTLFVTHDQGEALGMSDRVAVMQGGKILQLDSPINLYQRPTSRAIASFIGTMNFIEGIVERRDELRDKDVCAYKVALPNSIASFHVSRASRVFAEGERCLLCFRPENASFQDDRRNRVDVRVSRLTYVGERWVADCLLETGERLTINVPIGENLPAVGEKISIGWQPEESILLKLQDA